MATVPEAPADVPGDMREVARGIASWYGKRFHGRRTANGERFDMNGMTAAHRTLPFGTRVRVRSVDSGREVDVRINDRGPHLAGRIIDLSRAAALAIGLHEDGLEEVVLLVPADAVVPTQADSQHAAPPRAAKAKPKRRRPATFPPPTKPRE
jgi:rare lipoprotein A